MACQAWRFFHCVFKHGLHAWMFFHGVWMLPSYLGSLSYSYFFSSTSATEDIKWKDLGAISWNKKEKLVVAKGCVTCPHSKQTGVYCVLQIFKLTALPSEVITRIPCLLQNRNMHAESERVTSLNTASEFLKVHFCWISGAQDSGETKKRKNLGEKENLGQLHICLCPPKVLHTCGFLCGLK